MLFKAFCPVFRSVVFWQINVYPRVICRFGLAVLCKLFVLLALCLRHSCASLLLAHGVPMKQIQEWLGHSDFSTTANIYSHLDCTAKLSSAETLVSSLDFAPEPKPLPGQ